MMRQAAVLLAVLALSIAAAPETRMPAVTVYPEAARGPGERTSTSERSSRTRIARLKRGTIRRLETGNAMRRR